MQKIQVLDDCEAGADGEAADRGVDREADAMGANQYDDDRRFHELLDHRSHVAREGRERRLAAARSATALSSRLADGNDRAARHEAEHHAQPHELVAVEVEEHGEERGTGNRPITKGAMVDRVIEQAT